MVNCKFSEKDFISLLFHLLYQKGITALDENKLKKKLYYYKYEDLTNEIFQDIVSSCVSLDNEVNINQGLYFEKFFGGHINLIQADGTLTLDYHDDLEKISALMAKLSEEGQKQMLFLASSLSKRIKLENSYPNIDFYYTLASRMYHVYEGISKRTLITDGKINSVKEVAKDKIKGIDIKTVKALEVLVSDASFVILQDQIAAEVTKATIYTKENDEIKLKMMSKEALKKNENEEQWVRKLTLK